jgi:hypothetical protein
MMASMAEQRWFARRAAAALPAVFAFLSVQQPTPPSAAAAMGTYTLGTTHLVARNGSGCWLEAAPVRSDSMHLQILCRKPAPGHHLGVLDTSLPLRAGALVYETTKSAGHCRVTVRFVEARAIVAQDGKGLACGFGAFVDVGGSYVRLSKQRPPFDLVPIEKASASRPGEQLRVSPN